MWFMSFGSDIHVFICLVDLFDEWVYSFYNGGYLRFVVVKILGVGGGGGWLFNVK